MIIGGFAMYWEFVDRRKFDIWLKPEEYVMQLISYNLNGIRAALRNGLTDWLSQHNFDVLCFQEVKATADVVDLSGLIDLGYQYNWYAAEKRIFWRSHLLENSTNKRSNRLWLSYMMLKDRYYVLISTMLRCSIAIFHRVRVARFGRVSKWSFCVIL